MIPKVVIYEIINSYAVPQLCLENLYISELQVALSKNIRLNIGEIFQKSRANIGKMVK